MTSKPQTVRLPDLHLVVVRAKGDSEPEIKAAWHTLESRLISLKGRKFYGVSLNEESGPAYYAGLLPLDDDEIAALSLPTLFVKGGDYVRVELSDWTQHTDQIPVIVKNVEESFRTDPAGPVLEHYVSQSKLRLLVPLVRQDL